MEQNKLADEAMALHQNIFRALLDEEAKRDRAGRRIGDLNRIARLDRLMHATADRWRRIKGYAPIYRQE
jgi:hypothetical protein